MAVRSGVWRHSLHHFLGPDGLTVVARGVGQTPGKSTQRRSVPSCKYRFCSYQEERTRQVLRLASVCYVQHQAQVQEAPVPANIQCQVSWAVTPGPENTGVFWVAP